ncbi:MAG: polyprenyl synthetase family protein [Myxococcales bacterium]|nr:polyprenyl synthetase family protein [Myxococcales bacterium]
MTSAPCLTLPDEAPLDLEARPRVFRSLESAVRRAGPDGAEARLADLRAFLEEDLAGIERDLETLELGSTATHKSAGHLIACGGKRLRPMCVALAARVGSGFDAAARDLAVASELVHAATLLHDDVVDLGERRRGSPAARMIYGNAASIFAGDWLLVEALVRVRRTGLPDVLDKALGVLTEMLEAEAMQLDRRGKLDGSVADYLRVVTGKTASLFRWALFAGARAGGLDDRAARLMQTFGDKLGVAFQVTDDLLDVDGDPERIGKELYADLREGKATYPLLVALERRPALRGDLEQALAGGSVGAALAGSVSLAMRETGAIEETRALATRLVSEAKGALTEIGADDRPALQALIAVADAIASRRK